MSRTPGQKVVRFLAWSVLLPGLVVSLASFVIAVRTLRLGVTTVEGRITGRSPVQFKDRRGYIRYRQEAHVSFTTRTGQTVIFSDALAGAPLRYRTGSTVRVRYDPENPKRAEVLGSSVFSVLMAAFFFVIGVGTSALGALLLLAARVPWEAR